VAVVFAALLFLGAGRWATAAPTSASDSPSRENASTQVEPGEETEPPLDFEGHTVWGIFSGFGFPQEINGSAGGIQIATGGVRWSHLWSEKFGGILRGRPGFGIEALPLMSFIEDDRTTWAAGFNLLYEHHFVSRTRVRPIWKIGAGFLYANQEIPRGETQHNFSLLMDFGVDVMTSPRSAFYLGYRFHHVSNADTGDRNPGINVHTVTFGLSFYR